MSSQQTGEWWAEITHAFQTHVREEGYFLDAYEQLCEETADPAARFLIQLILDDERRHHALFERMAAAARGDVPPGSEVVASAPIPPRSPEAGGAQLLESTERFLEAELDDRKHLRRLRKKLKPVEDDTMWHLMIELMELDTAKHVKILEYLTARLRRAP